MKYDSESMTKMMHKMPFPIMVSVVVAVYLLISVILPHSCDGFANGHAKRIHLHRRGYDNTVLYDASDSFLDDEANSSGGFVSVNIQRDLPNVTPHEARDAWIEYHWKKGGGLPIAILSKKDSPDDIITTDTEQSTTTVEEHSLERTILPIIMKERAGYVDSKSLDAKSLDIQYKVTDAGPFFADLIPGSHDASVHFEEATTSNDCSFGCIMTWDVTFSTTRWSSFYEAVTRFTVGTAATTIQEAVSPPRLFSMTTTIEGSFTIEPEIARRECLDFVFGEGGGLPLLPPIPFGDSVLSDSKSARQKLIRIPPLIVESIVGTTTSDNMADFAYCLDDPGWKTFPFLLHTHLGKVSFTKSNDSLSSESDLIINWDVEIRPYKFVSGVMQQIVEMTVTTIMRNLRVRLTEPGAQIVVKQPRGKGEQTFGKVSKDTWLGGVLQSHLSDQRSTLDQTITLLQPWTWGRSGRGDENDCVHFQWTDGNIPREGTGEDF